MSTAKTIEVRLPAGSRTSADLKTKTEKRQIKKKKRPYKQSGRSVFLIQKIRGKR